MKSLFFLIKNWIFVVKNSSKKWVVFIRSNARNDDDFAYVIVSLSVDCKLKVKHNDDLWVEKEITKCVYIVKWIEASLRNFTRVLESHSCFCCSALGETLFLSLSIHPQALNSRRLIFMRGNKAWNRFLVGDEKRKAALKDWWMQLQVNFDWF